VRLFFFLFAVTFNMPISQVLIIIAATLLAATMGFAIQRGATCTVAAVDEAINKRRMHRLASMLEASLWVVGGLLIARLAGQLMVVPHGYAVTLLTLLGGALLGLGAYINQACVFGAIARLGSGEWAYVATPPGFYLGCISAPWIFRADANMPLAGGSPVFDAPLWLVLAVFMFLCWRAGTPLWQFFRGTERSLRTRLAKDLAPRVWAPHAATGVIGVTFFFLLLLMGAWAYTDVLAELARGMSSNLAVRTWLLLALLAGAMLGGWTAGRFRRTPISGAQLLKCLVGGILMGWGSLLIPGSNDGLILLGMPLFWPYAWVAFLSMCLTIAAAMLITSHYAPRAGGK
jgi:toxin CptA